MTQPPDEPNLIEQARAAWTGAATQVENTAGYVAGLEDDLARLRREDPPDNALIAQRTAERDAALRQLGEHRRLERAMRVRLRDTINATIPPRSIQFGPLSSEWPIVFLPIRIETRFDRQTPSLLVRIYPDELEVSTHETPLTSAEAAAGTEFWSTFNKTPSEHAQAWRKLLMHYPSTRAAWIVRSTLSLGGGNFNLFPTLRSSSWSNPAVTRVMPDCWVVRAYRAGALVVEKVGRAIPDPLPVSLDPGADPNDPSDVADLSGQGLELDRDIAWTLDFPTAEQNGMAVRIPLQPADLQQGFDELIVAGVKASLPAIPSAHRLAALFDGHHYSRGFAFPRLGTPTKNTSDTRSGHPADDTGGAHSFPIERGDPLNRPGGNGIHFVNALGFESWVVEHIENADLLEQSNARAFHNAVFPSTLGYFLRQMMDPLFSAAEVEEIRSWFVDLVRGRGPLPPVRVLNKPYGVLPVMTLQRAEKAAANAPIEARLGPELQRIVGLWASQLGAVPRIGRSKDADADLMSTLAMDGRTQRVHVRSAVGPVGQWNLISFLGTAAPWPAAQSAAALSAFTQIGRPQWNALIGWMSFDAQIDRFAFELVAPVVSETAPLSFNYIRWLRTSSIADIRAEKFPPGITRPRALLYPVLRQAVLHEYLRLADLLIGTPRRPEDELIGFSNALDTPFQRLDRKLPITGTKTIAQYLLDPANDGKAISAASYRASLAAIEELPTAELERLFTETLDTCSHRIDAWITSLATRELARVRARAPFGSWIGGYGWLENVIPPPPPATQTLPDGRAAIVQSGGGGHIHGPSMTHASAAAVLRNAALANAGTLDLSSARVRKALRVLDAVRAGESLGSVLGAQFERGLRARGTHPDLQKTVDALRNRFPIAANKIVATPKPPYSVAARNVVDGLRLHEGFRDNNLNLTGLVFAPPLPSWIDAELKDLGDTVDAITELLTAESVFQTLRNNHAAAAASIETMSRGVRPPQPEIVQQPRGGTTLTHRFAVILGEGQTPPAGWVQAPSPRALAAPHLDAWIGKLLGNPATIRCRLSWPDPQPGFPGNLALRVLSLQQLMLRPVDFLAIARAESDGGTSELDLRLAAVAQAPLGVEVTIDNAPWPDRNTRTFAEAIEMAIAIGDVVQGARPLRPGDLLETASADATRPVAAAATNRANAARTALGQLALQLRNAISLVISGGVNANLAPLRTQCAAAAQFGVAGAYAAARAADRAELLERADLVQLELARRAREAAPKTIPHEIAQSVFGRDFVFLYEFLPWRAAELGQALAYAPSLPGDPFAARRWLQGAAPVRAPVQRWQRMARFANAMGGGASSLDVVQLPFVAGARWVALPFANESQRPPAGRVSIVLHRPATPTPTSMWTGLLIDEWSEVIPSAVEQTAVSLGYSSPRAESPQAILVGVPPANALWDFDLIFETLRETFRNARLRAVDLEALGSLGQLLPPLFLGANADDETISTNLTSLLMKT